ncbi:MAG: hypothetical protein QOJ63_3263 [Solirubrobacteraceae bacterium]|nr:hypothetical protein [Solirubrobacteraceae bacterium]
MPDDLHELVKAVTVVTGQIDELASAHDDVGAGRTVSDGDATSAAELQQALISQQTQGAQHRVAVDLKHRCEIPGRWQAFPRSGVAFGDRASDLRGDLLVQAQYRVRTTIDRAHGARNTSFNAHGPVTLLA